MRLPEGRVYVHQDHNYNVTNLTDLTGRVLERTYYSPYGQPEIALDAHFFDYDDDGDVDENDLAAATSSGPCWGSCSGDCKRLPVVYNSRLGNPFGHQGLVLDAEIGSYQNRARQYGPSVRRFIQRDPLVSDSLMYAGLTDWKRPEKVSQSVSP